MSGEVEGGDSLSSETPTKVLKDKSKDNDGIVYWCLKDRSLLFLDKRCQDIKSSNFSHGDPVLVPQPSQHETGLQDFLLGKEKIKSRNTDDRTEPNTNVMRLEKRVLV